MRKLASFCFLVCVCFGQISAPRIGFVRDKSGNIRPLGGVAGAFVVGEPVVTGAVSASFSERYGLVKTSGELLVLVDGQVRDRRSAPDGLASFGFSASGRPDWVRFATGECLVWKADRFDSGSCPAAVPEATGAGDELVLRDSGVRVRVPSLIQTVESVAPGWVAVQTDSGSYLVRTEHGRESLFELPGAAE